MFARKISFALMIAAFASTSLVHAADADGFYAGIKGGVSHFQDFDFDAATNPGLVPTQKKDGAAGVFFGYQINNWLGLEAGFDYLGKVKFSDDVTSATIRQTARDAQLSAKFSTSLTDSLDAYTRLGVVGTRFSGDLGHATKVGALAALGLEYSFNENLSARAEYQWATRFGDQTKLGVKTDNSFASLGLVYHFVAPKAPVVAAAVLTPAVVAPVIQTRQFSLAADALFDFNKDTLKPEGVAVLTDFVNKLAAEKLSNVSLQLVGNTDFIGSEEYNMGLSQRRAQTVAHFLESKGTPAAAMSVSGVGETNPVTNGKCAQVHPRAALIACLAPDRRVDITVQGVATVQ